MPKLPQVSGKKVVKILIKEGWIYVSQKGSHVKLTKKPQPIGQATVIIPQHKTIKKGTLSKILKDTGLSIEKL